MQCELSELNVNLSVSCWLSVVVSCCAVRVVRTEREVPEAVGGALDAGGEGAPPAHAVRDRDEVEDEAQRAAAALLRQGRRLQDKTSVSY